MNYYPTNLYGNFGYGGLNNPHYSQLQGAPQQLTQPSLQGKIVDGEAVVKATEIPFGGFGVFPKADFSEIYIKSWNNNGTTDIITFKPIETEKTESEEYSFSKIILKLEAIENKLNNLPVATPTPKENIKIIETQKKGVNF